MAFFLSSSRRRGSRKALKNWIPAFAGMMVRGWIPAYPLRHSYGGQAAGMTVFMKYFGLF